jgi:hypothetical protein
VKSIPSSAASDSNTPRCEAISWNSASAMLSVGAAPLAQIFTSRSASPYGSGRNTMVSTMLKVAVAAPTPSASVSTAAMVTPRLRPAMRRP